MMTEIDQRWSFTDQYWMRHALRLAAEANSRGEVPVGAVLVLGTTPPHTDPASRLFAEGSNETIALQDPTAHAEMLAIRRAAALAANYRLTGSTLYVTLEPCAMCAGAIVNARIARLVFAARDLRWGAVRSKFRLADSDLLNHRVAVEEGLFGAQATAMLQAFFERRRSSSATP